MRTQDPEPGTTTDGGGVWRRRDVPQAGVSVPQNPDWASLENILADRGIVYQRFGATGMAFVSYGPESTPDGQLANIAADAMTTYTVDADETIDFLGATARRVRLRLHRARAAGHRRGPSGPEALPAAEHEVFVFVGFTRNEGPVLVGYRVAESELPAFEPLLERVISGVRPL